MRTRKLGIHAAAIVGIVTLVGCESLSPMGPSLVAQHMGDAVQTNIAQQTENPNAAYDNTETPRIDPDTAAIVMDRYYQSQNEAADQQPASIININAN